MRRNNSKFFTSTERQWDSCEQPSYVELIQELQIRCAVKRLFTGALQLPRLSCRHSAQTRGEDGASSGPAGHSIKHSRSLGTLTSCIPRDL
ncbi:hypothetical protein OJAV_G00165960 [Oryzias javanicus]|uniref:Uncharacterized protein n=1 Tax=Oryzias javanicus TaxID=123683 RepID=A0A437CFE9_ORYJA|nr:hypothetical protein OJAV_G00165960 [Oryzias javanicus]